MTLHTCHALPGESTAEWTFVSEAPDTGAVWKEAPGDCWVTKR